MAGKERRGTILSQHHILAAAGGALKLLDCSEWVPIKSMQVFPVLRSIVTDNRHI
ncbi:MAG: hypothetical protein U9Q37_02340 [Euryarchaeota archaeon]|nr:hypothetical protein [Euryarchaeota archaeon]